MVEVFPRLLPPLWVTIKVSFISLFLAFFIGLFLGTINSIFSKFNPINLISRTYVWLVLCTPIIIQIYAAYLLLPKVGIKLDVFWIGVIALTFNSAGYQTEISRASISSIAKGQYEIPSTLKTEHHAMVSVRSSLRFESNFGKFMQGEGAWVSPQEQLLDLVSQNTLLSQA